VARFLGVIDYKVVVTTFFLDCGQLWRKLLTVCVVLRRVGALVLRFV
jgi:hypothetical protein